MLKIKKKNKSYNTVFFHTKPSFLLFHNVNILFINKGKLITDKNLP